MASYLGNSPDVILQVRKRNYRYVATGGQNTFNGNDSNGQSLFVNTADVEVFLNGVLLDQTDYTITSTQLQLTLNAALDDIVEIITNTTFAVADQYSKSEVDSKVALAVTDLIGTAGSALNTLGELSDALNDDANYAATITTALGTKANSSDVTTALALKANTSSLATVATSGSYTDLSNKPTISVTAISDQSNTSTGYFDLPTGNTSQRPGSATTGNIRYNSEITGVEYYDGSTWKQIEVVETDPYWGSVVLSMNGGTLTDYKSRHTFSTVNVSTSSSPGKPFPNARESSWYYVGNGTNNYIDVLGNINDFDPQLYTNFTIEFWMNHSGQTSSYGHFYNIGGQDSQGVIKFSGNNAYGLYWYSSNGEMINFGGSGTNPANTWIWYVYEKNGSTNTTWRNGIRISQNTNSLPAGNPSYLRLGGPFSSEYSGHYFDELRVTTVARYQGAASIPIQTKSWPKQ